MHEAHPAGGVIGLVITTVSATAHAEEIAARLVEERLAACVTTLPGARSHYRWKGVSETVDEIVVVAKTRPTCVGRVAARVRALHPYELPEILCCHDVRTSAAYAAWVEEEVEPCPSDPS